MASGQSFVATAFTNETEVPQAGNHSFCGHGQLQRHLSIILSIFLIILM